MKIAQTIAGLLVFAATCAFCQDTNYAVKVLCDFQDQDHGIKTLRFLQGSAPMVQAVPMNGASPVAADSSTTAQLVFAQTPTSTLFVATNAYLATNGAYWIQIGTIGTNSCPTNSTVPSPWWYSILFYRNGGIYWAGSGQLFIESTTSTGTNGITWQEWAAGAAKDDLARQWIASLSNTVEGMVGGSTDVVARAWAYSNATDIVNVGNTATQAWIAATGAAAVAAAAVPASATSGWTVTTHAGLATGTPIYVETDATAMGQGFATTNGAGQIATNVSASYMAGSTGLALDAASNLVVSGASGAYTANPATPYTLGVAATAPAKTYALWIYSTNAVTLTNGYLLTAAWTATGTNLIVLTPTGTVYRVTGKGY